MFYFAVLQITVRRLEKLVVIVSVCRKRRWAITIAFLLCGHLAETDCTVVDVTAVVAGTLCLLQNRRKHSRNCEKLP